MVKISKYQLFCLLLLFEFGSSSLFVLGIEAKQDAWIAIVLASLGGFLLIFVYTSLQKLFPKDNLVEILIKLLGKTIGIPLALIYGLLFFYKSSIILHEFGDLIKIFYLPNSPIIFVFALVLLLMLYIIFQGIEVLVRSSEIMLPIYIFFLVITYILIIASGRVQLKELLPVLQDGIKPVIYAGYPRILNFPYGETMVFFMFWGYVAEQKAVQKTSLKVVVVYGIFITTTAILIISVLGPELASHSTVPLLALVKLINLADVVTNLDAIATTIIFIGGFYKTTTFLYGGILVFSALLKINKKIVAVVFSISVFVFSYYFIRSYQFNIWLGGKIHPLFINTPLQNINPILLLIIAYIKIKRNKLKIKKEYKND